MPDHDQADAHSAFLTDEFLDVLTASSEGDAESRERLTQLMYVKLRRMARGFMRNERSGHTMQPTDLVHETYLRMLDQAGMAADNAGHFVAIAATMMRRVLINHAKARNCEKRGAGAQHLTLSASELVPQQQADAIDVLTLDTALNELAEKDPRLAQLVELRYFGGLSIEQTAAVMAISSATVKREWVVAKLWLLRRLSS
jgi:RNA polymerase sigma factor (TIGR02999 family)